MRFKNYLTEGIIVPPKLDIKTTDIDALNKQFSKYTNPEFEFKHDSGPHGAYIPKLDKIIIYVSDDLDVKTLETLIQHEIIHAIQDLKSGMRMAQVIQKQQDEIRNLANYLDDFDDDEEINPDILTDLMQKKKELEIKMEHLNPEEEMVYAYMFVKMYRKLGFKEVLKKLQSDWKNWTNTKPSKRLLKYLGLYWAVREQL